MYKRGKGINNGATNPYTGKALREAMVNARKKGTIFTIAETLPCCPVFVGLMNYSGRLVR